MTYDVLIFDLDGTLMDSSACVVGAAQRALIDRGFPEPNPQDILVTVGLPLESMMQHLLPDEGAETHRDLAAGYRDVYRELAADLESLFEGARELLESLQARGMRMGVATGKSHEGAQNSVERRRIRSFFEAVHGIQPGTPGKPHPALLERVLEDLGADPKRALLIGDTVYDLEMAARASVDACAVTWGVHGEKELTSRNPRWLVRSLDELGALLLG